MDVCSFGRCSVLRLGGVYSILAVSGGVHTCRHHGARTNSNYQVETHAVHQLDGSG